MPKTIYPDNYSESLQTYLEYTGQVDAEGCKFGTNTDTGKPARAQSDLVRGTGH